MGDNLKDILSGYQKELGEINRKIENERTLFLKDFFHLRSELNSKYDIVDRIVLSDGALILLWVKDPKTKNKMAYGPYWYRCKWHRYSEDFQAKRGKKGKYHYVYIGARLKETEKLRFDGAGDENKWKLVRDIDNWEEYMKYDKRIADYRALRDKVVPEIKRVKGYIRYGHLDMSTVKEKKRKRAEMMKKRRKATHEYSYT